MTDHHSAPLRPEAAIRRADTVALPRRFYKEATVVPQGSAFGVALDGRPARTPARQPLALPTEALAQAVADEWNAVETTIDPRVMPTTRLVNSILDGVKSARAEVAAEIVKYAGSDLLVYRADSPAELVAEQEALWTPIMTWSAAELEAPFRVATGVMHIAQPRSTLDKIAAALDRLCGVGEVAAFRLGALHVMTTLTGSALLALAVGAGRLDAAEAWRLAHVDEDHQIAQWGEDEEARQRRAARWTDMETAARLFELSI